MFHGVAKEWPATSSNCCSDIMNCGRVIVSISKEEIEYAQAIQTDGCLVDKAAQALFTAYADWFERTAGTGGHCVGRVYCAAPGFPRGGGQRRLHVDCACKSAYG